MIQAKELLSAFRESIDDFFLDESQNTLRKAEIQNPWFTQDSIRQSLLEWKQALHPDSITKWLDKYHITEFEGHSKTVGIIGAGNIPLVVMHDVLCVLLAGCNIHLKLSSEDDILPKFWFELVSEKLDQSLPIEYVEKLNSTDMVIATGSNNTHRYFEFYFKDKPSILRKSRSSVAVLPESLTDQQVDALGEDIFRYFGMGCRNVTQLWVPQEFEFAQLFERWNEKYDQLINHNKYANNYHYHKALLLMNLDPHIDAGFVLFHERDTLHAPVGLVNFAKYNEPSEVSNWLNSNSGHLQCILSEVNGIDGLSYGIAQKPNLWDYADNVDTLDWLFKQVNK